jgi:hypothetical protein
MPAHARLFAENYRVSQLADFPRWMIQQIRMHEVSTMRIHVAGDFYDTSYVLKWLQIVQTCPSTKFFAYTRSWQPDSGVSYDALERLAAQPNVQLWWSADLDTGKPLHSHVAKVAYMMTSDVDIPRYKVDLLFRVDPASPMKQLLGTKVCPAENGVATTPKMTCTACQLCCVKTPKTEQKTPVYSITRERSVSLRTAALT